MIVAFDTDYESRVYVDMPEGGITTGMDWSADTWYHKHNSPGK
jgi:hypothetical protein